MKKNKILTLFMILSVVLNALMPSISAVAVTKSNRVGTGTITGSIFEDINGNAIQDTNESGVSDTIVHLLDSSKNELKNVKTNKNGRYSFENIPADNYYLKVDIPERYEHYTSGSARFDKEGNSRIFNVGENQVYTGGQLGLLSTDAKINGTVFNDSNKNGEKDSIELGISGIEMGLYLAGMTTPIQRKLTDINGKYTFEKIAADKEYEVRIVSLPSQYQVIKNSNFDETGKSNPLYLTSLETKNNINLALFENIDVSDLIVEPEKLDQYVGDTGKLKVSIIPDDATDKAITFKSDKPEIITVDAEGNWVAKSAGTAIITVTASNGKSKQVPVTVKEKDVDVSDFIVEPTELNQYVGDTGALKVTITPENATDKTIKFVSKDSSIITVDASGNWVAKSVGKTVIIVTASNGESKEVPVTVKEKDVPANGLTVEPKILDQYVGDTGKLKVTVTPENATDKSVTYTSNDSDIIIVDSSGNWVAKKVGVTTITVETSNKITETVMVIVREKNIPLVDIDVQPTELNQFVGDKDTLKITFTPNDATNKKLIFISYKPDIITVDANGNWEAKAVGETTILVVAENGITKPVKVTVKEKDIPVQDITVEPSSLDQYVGDTGTLKVIFTPSDATNKNLTFSSVDPDIITVDANGNWEAKAVGKTKIIVMTDNYKWKLVDVTVREKSILVDELIVEPKLLDQYVGDTGTLKVTIKPDNATDKKLNFESADSSIITVDQNGNWEAKKTGVTTIKVTGSNNKSANVTVIVREKNIPVDGISVEPSSLDQYVGDTGTLKVTITPENATNKKLTFESLDTSIITVDSNGNWEAKAVGTTMIVVTSSSGINAYVSVIVREKNIPVDSITVEPKELDQFVGDTGALKVTILPNNATDKTLTFESADPTIMTVDANGNWEAKSVGNTTIIVKSSNDKTFEVKVTVKKKISQGVGVSYYDYPLFLGQFEFKGTGTATNFDDAYIDKEPYPGLGTDHYKIKKVGYVTLDETGMYKFSIEIADNAAVYIDDVKILDRDKFIGGALSNSRYLKAGQTIKICTEHYHRDAKSSYFRLRWWTPKNPYSPLPIPDSRIMMEN